MSGKNQGKVRDFLVNDKWQPCCESQVPIGPAFLPSDNVCFILK